MTTTGTDDESDRTTTAEDFARIARVLAGAPTTRAAEEGVTRAALEIVPGCRYAAISLVDRHGGVVTVAPTSDVPRQVDAIQYATAEGPCLDAIREAPVCTVPDLATERRWPEFCGRAVAETGVRSMLAFRLFVEDDVLGALNLYSRTPGAFGDRAVAVGTVLAAHAALAVTGARHRARSEQLDEALRSSREIGIAIGVLMARRLVSRDVAFSLLREASRTSHRKLREVAWDVAETGHLPRGARHRRTR